MTGNRDNYLSALDYGNGDRVQYTYDDKGRVTKQTYEDGATVSYKYDNSGALATVTDSATGRTTTYYYDAIDRLMKYVESGENYSHSVAYTYDNINNLTAQVETINGVETTTGYIYDDDNRVTSVTAGGTETVYAYDNLGRVATETVKQGDATILTTTYTYEASTVTDATTSRVASKHINDSCGGGFNVTYSYTYDDNGNILSVSDGTNTTSYVYDAQNQLTRENNQAGNFTHTWEYDTAGNIKNRKEYAYTTGTLDDLNETVSYGYDDSDWGDLLTSYDGDAITYDAIGNPTYSLVDGEYDLYYTWKHGRQLVSREFGDSYMQFTYNADGMRTKATCNDDVYEYVYNGSQLVQMKADSWMGDAVMAFTYDAGGTPQTITYNGTTYYYVTNLQGDVITILDGTGMVVVQYTYDAWGKLLSTTGTMAYTLGRLNPLRYRGYVYDMDSGLYYLQSRYYDAEIGRFINADAFNATGQGLLGNNMFAYCANNPVANCDSSGYRHERTFGGGDGCFTNPGPAVSLWEIIEREVNNEDPMEALDDDALDFYKGVPVIKTSLMDKSAFTFGVIIMGNEVNDPNLLYHEYGHILQMEEIGVLGYIQYVVIPSVTCFWATEVGVLHDDLYYNLPWENIADRYGGASGDYMPGATKFADVYWGFARGFSKLY